MWAPSKTKKVSEKLYKRVLPNTVYTELLKNWNKQTWNLTGCAGTCLTCCFSLLVLCEIIFSIFGWWSLLNFIYHRVASSEEGGRVCPFDFIAFAPPNRGVHSFPTLCKRCTTRCNKGGKCERIQMLEQCNMSQSDCGTHSHVVVCMRCMLRLISPLTAKRKKNSWELMTACAILFLRFVNREGERSVVSVVVFMFWFT